MFYKTARGEVINLDHLVTLRPSAGDRVRGLMTDGSEVQLQDYDARLIVNLTRSVVAARPEDRAVVFSWYGEDSEPTHEAQDVPVIAWALDGNVMAPVFADHIAEGQQSVGPMAACATRTTASGQRAKRSSKTRCSASGDRQREMQAAAVWRELAAGEP